MEKRLDTAMNTLKLKFSSWKTLWTQSQTDVQIFEFGQTPPLSELFDDTIVSHALSPGEKSWVEGDHKSLEETFATGWKSKNIYFQIFNSQIRTPVIWTPSI